MTTRHTSSSQVPIPAIEPQSRTLVVGDQRIENAKPAFAEPVFILSVPRSFSSVVCAMLGQHPQMYGLPETNLFGARTLGEWWASGLRAEWRTEGRAEWPMLHGLLRAIAQIYFGEQTESTVKMAAGWIRRRAHFSTGFLLEILAENLSPLTLVEKSPHIVRRVEFMRRAYSMFPQARFIHLVRHPRSQGESFLKFAAVSRVPEWQQVRDPQQIWYIQNMNICDFLKLVPENQKLRIRGEALLGDPQARLSQIAGWLGLRTDTEAIEKMKYPERSPFAYFGPPGARFGNDPSFLKNPKLRPTPPEPQALDGPVSWHSNGNGFLPSVRELAEGFGYE
jgi:hypothetical protein